MLLKGVKGMGADNNKNNKRPLTSKSMPPAGDEHAMGADKGVKLGGLC